MNGPSWATHATPGDADAPTAGRCLGAINRPLDWHGHATDRRREPHAWAAIV